MSVATESIVQLAINTIRTLSMDAVEAANSGHPGTPMALAPVAYTVWQHGMRYDPAQPSWPNRDRFVLSCGHASMLLYSMLHLTGVKEVERHTGKITETPAVSLDDIRKFRQLYSKTPGHPEYRHTSGVETTTGPLGQGCGNSVGMAIASRWLASTFNKPGFEIFNYKTFVLCSDGDLMEGVSAEAASIAGHLRLSNLVWIWDDNKITIEGDTELAFTEDVGARFKAYGWHVLHVDDANDLDSLAAALDQAAAVTDKPTFIVLKSIIGYGAPTKAGSHKAHGEPLGAKEIAGAKKSYGLPENESFRVLPEVLEHFQNTIGSKGAKLSAAWGDLFEAYRKKYPELAAQWEMMDRGDLPAGWDKDLPVFPTDPKGVASRASSGKVQQAVGKGIPWFIGGSADLAPSTKTLLEFDGAGDFEPGHYGGRNFHWGIREHGMGAVLNGMQACHIRSYGATFLVFSDYCRPSMRLSAIMEVPTLWIFTHDSIGVGEDGPTHQPIEHLAALRAISGMFVMRPGDANEVTEAWRTIMPRKNRPHSLILTRQNLPTLDRSKYASAAGVAQGGYILADSQGTPEVILIATGSELSLAVESYEKLTAEGVKARVVSMPCVELFEEQSAEYREKVLPKAVKPRVIIEAATSFGWHKYAGDGGKLVTIDHFGASGPAPLLFKEFGFTTENIVAKAKEAIAGK
ncbi:MAG TPA: transketolase [Pirellulales bacterium]